MGLLFLKQVRPMRSPLFGRTPTPHPCNCTHDVSNDRLSIVLTDSFAIRPGFPLSGHTVCRGYCSKPL